MLQEINRALILMAFALTAQGQSPDSLLGQLEREVNIEAGKIEEPCFAMALADRLEYEFSSDEALDFNLHYHQGNAIFFPVERKNIHQHEAVFVSTGSRKYCLMWSNRGENPVTLRYRYQLYRSAVPQ
ncbi:MAG: hypothetical protein O7F73_19555 [Gammaproteobacteria bacterium]|nr:hypothetical protein [Gammaproteobacteria bacterium]